MKQTSINIETRWPVVAAIIIVTTTLSLMRARIQLLPPWAYYTLPLLLIIPMLGVQLGKNKSFWLNFEKFTTIPIAVFIEMIVLLIIFYLIHQMIIFPDAINGRVLLSTGVSGWIVNILTFSLIYWRIDRNGPESRANENTGTAQWSFPQPEMPIESNKPWSPTYIDYLFLAFSTSTAFSTTETVPLTHHSKLLMMTQSIVSMIILMVVASRAINIIGAS